jgi:hypothetical protein
MAQSDIARRADAIKLELNTRTERLAKDLQGEFAQDDAKSVTNKEFHEIVRRNWSDPNWRVATAQRMGPVALFKVAMEAFGRSLDGSASKDSHPDALAAEPKPTELQPPDTEKPSTAQAPSPPLPSVFPFQGPSMPRPVPGMPPPPPAMPLPPPGATAAPPPPMQPIGPQ